MVKAVESLGMDIVVLTETKKKGQGQEVIGDYIHIWTGVDKTSRAKSGVSVLIKKKWKREVVSWKEINERIIRITMSMFGVKLEIIGVYGPNDDDTVDNKRDFYEDLGEVVDECSDSSEMLIMGDFNGRVGRKINDEIVGQWGEDTINDNGRRLIDFCTGQECVIMNGKFKHKDIHKFTWVRPSRNQKSIIDYVITKIKRTIKIQDVMVKRGVECGSDHHIVTAKVAFPIKANLKLKEREESNGISMLDSPRYMVHLLQESSVKYLYQQRLTNKLAEANEDWSAAELYEYLKHSIMNAAEEALGIEKENRGKTEWLTKDILGVIEEKKALYRKWLSTKNEEDFEEYKRCKKKVKKMVKLSKEEQWEKYCGEIDHTLGYRRSAEAWKALKK